METTSVVVIGGGAAGLAAFQALRAAGCDAVLLEARRRWGGRIHTMHPQGWAAPVELGAEFLHGALPPGTALEPEPEIDGRQDWSVLDDALLPAEEFAGGADVVLVRLQTVRGPDQTFAEFLETCADLPASARASAWNFIEGYEAADPRRISVASLQREFAAESEGAGPRRPRGGYGQLLDALEVEGRKHLGAPVMAVHWRRGAVTVSAKSAGSPLEIRARAAIVTLPLAVLQQGGVQFDPALSAKHDALQGLIMGGAVRLTLRLREPIWHDLCDDQGMPLAGLRFLFGSAATAGHFPTWWTHPLAPQITGWAAGRHAWALAGLPPERLQQRALTDLSERLRVPAGMLEKQLLEAHGFDWQSDPFTGGAYSYAGVGAAGAHAELARPLAHSLFFAGEATDASGHHATVVGALASGRRAAVEALDAIS